MHSVYFKLINKPLRSSTDLKFFLKFLNEHCNRTLIYLYILDDKSFIHIPNDYDGFLQVVCKNLVETMGYYYYIREYQF